MPLKAFVLKLDSVEESQQAFYRETDGGFLLDIAPVNGFVLENVDGLKTTLGKFKRSNENLTSALEAFKDADGNIVDIIALKASAKKGAELEGKVPEVKTAVDAALAEAQTLFDQKYSNLETVLSSRSDQLKKVLIDDQATKALVAHDGNIRLLLPHIRTQVTTREIDGEYRVDVVDTEGNPRVTLKDGRTADMTIADLVVEMSESEDFLAAFKGSGNSGHGGPGDHGDGNRDAVGFVSRDNLHIGNFDLDKVAAGETQLRD